MFQNNRATTVRWLLGTCVLAFAMAPQVALAQEQTVNPALPCQVVETVTKVAAKMPEPAPPKWLTAVCGKAGVWIGNAQSYESAYNPVLGSLLVVLHDPGRTRVVLVTPSPKGFLRVDDVSRELARTSGRLPDEGLGEVVIDTTTFAALGRISVPKGNGAGLADIAAKAAGKGKDLPAASTERVTLDLAQYAGAERQLKE